MAKEIVLQSDELSENVQKLRHLSGELQQIKHESAKILNKIAELSIRGNEEFIEEVNHRIDDLDGFSDLLDRAAKSLLMLMETPDEPPRHRL